MNVRQGGGDGAGAPAGAMGVLRRHETALVLALLAIGLFLRLVTINSESMWIDEGFALAVADLPLVHLWTVPFDTHPPVFPTLVKLFATASDGEWAVRLPSAVFGAATLVPVYLLARRFFDMPGALAAMAVWALSFTQLVYANNGRNYAVLVFFLMLAAYALHGFALRLMAGHPVRARQTILMAGLYLIGGVGALYSHTLAVIYLFSLNALVCAYLLATERARFVSLFVPIAGLNGVMLAVWLPWLVVMMAGAGAFNWLTQMGPAEAARTLVVTIGPNAVPFVGVGVFLLAVLVGSLEALRRGGWLAVMIVFHLAIFPAFIWLIGFVYTPLYMERAILPATLGAALAIGALTETVRLALAARLLAVGALVATAVSAGQYVLRDDEETNLGAHLIQDWRGAVEARDGLDVTFVICDIFGYPTVDHYRDRARLIIHDDMGLWQMGRTEWLALFGQPISERLSGETWHAPGHTPLLVEWEDIAANGESVVFLKPDIYCNDGEDHTIRAELDAAGYTMTDTRHYRGVLSETYAPEPR